MNVVDYQFAQVTRLSTITRKLGNPYFPFLSNLFKEKYGFTGLPDHSSEESTRFAFEFRHGVFGDVTIDRLALYRSGIVANAASTVELVEHFVDDVVDLIRESLQTEELSSLPVVRLYDSHVVVESTIEFTRSFQLLQEVGSHISTLLNQYGTSAKQYQTAGIVLHSDEPDVGNFKTSKFTFERRIDTPFSANMFFSSAPLRTEDHINLLSEMERFFN